MIATEREGKIPSYLNFPYDRFLKLRVEFLILTQNELEAKLLRVIEWCTETKLASLYMQAIERTPQGQKVGVPDEIWTPITHRFFMECLYGTVQSETTLKNALKSLEKKHLIFKRSGQEYYDASEFLLNKPLITKLFEQFPPDIADVDLSTIMKQPRNSRTQEQELEGGQKLTPSEIDPLLQKFRETIIDPLNHQLLTVGGAKIDPLAEREGGQKLTPKRYRKDTKKEKREDSSSYTVLEKKPETQNQAISTAAAVPSALNNFSLDDLTTLKKNIDTLLQIYQNNLNVTEQSPIVIEDITAAPSEQNKQNEQNEQNIGNEEKKGVEIDDETVNYGLEHPHEQAPRTAETVVQLIEHLRGQRFEQRGAQLRDAQLLLSLQPPVLLQEIEEAWQHGSDAYWRERDPLGMTVSDLKNREKISGKPRILACLEHKRIQDRKQQRMVHTHTEQCALQTPIPKPPVPSLSEEQAKVLAQHVTEVGNAQNYNLRGTVVPLETGGWKVVASWQSSAWRGNLGLDVFSDEQWEKAFKSWQKIIQIRASRKKAVAMAQEV